MKKKHWNFFSNCFSIYLHQWNRHNLQVIKFSNNFKRLVKSILFSKIWGGIHSFINRSMMRLHLTLTFRWSWLSEHLLASCLAVLVMGSASLSRRCWTLESLYARGCVQGDWIQLVVEVGALVAAYPSFEGRTLVIAIWMGQHLGLSTVHLMLSKRLLFVVRCLADQTVVLTLLATEDHLSLSDSTELLAGALLAQRLNSTYRLD